MKFTTNLSRSFADRVFNTDYLLEESVDWIGSNLSPEQVFDRTLLEDWANDNGFILEKINEN